MESSTALVSLIVGLPLLGFLIHGITGLISREYRSRHAFIGTLSTLFVFIPFLILLYLFFQFNAESNPLYVSLFRWIDTGSLQVDAAYRIDQLSLVMSLVVTGVGSLIHLYSMGYMSHDKGYWKFFAYLNLFIFAMLNLVLSNNLLLMFLGWEGVGVCSYLLIGFWYTDMKKSDAAKKAFIYNRVGDFAFLVAMFIIFGTVGSLNFDVILNSIGRFTEDQIFWVALLMLIGATGKSAQIPLFLWLPDAMAGPTPVSALIHAATMVTSGIYLFARMSPMIIVSPEAMMIVAFIGALTAIVAATIAITQTDIKGVLAYSTVSQLGFMFLALGSGAFTAAIFHVVTHAFFKACLFLGSGSVIHAMEHVKHALHKEGKAVEFDHQDIRYMGGLKKYMPSTYKTFLISTIAIAGIPPLAGFFSKDEILMHAVSMGISEFAGPLYYLLWVVASLTAFLTAFYMFRLTFTTFGSQFRLPQLIDGIPDAESHLHESPKTMTFPLWVLAVLAVVAGFIGLPNFFAKTFGSYAEIHWLEHWLHPVVSNIPLELSVGFEWLLMITAILIALAGVYFAKEMYADGQMEFSDEELEYNLSSIYPVWKEKYRLDEFYHSMVIRPVLTFSEKILAVFDLKILDGFVNFTGGTVRFFGSLVRYSQSGITGQYALFLILGVVLILALLLF